MEESRRVQRREYGLHAPRREPRDADDAGARVLLRRARRPLEHADDHDPELRLDGDHDGALVARRLLALLQRRRGRDLRELPLRVPAARRRPLDLRAVADPARRADRLPDDVRDHHAGADHRRVHEPRHVQGVPALPRRLAARRLLPVRAHALGRRPARALGRARLRRRHRRARERRLRRAGVGPLRREAEVRRLAAQHPVHRARHRPALVRLVRLQRRQRAEGRRHHVARVPQHRSRRLVRRGDVAVRRVAAATQAALRRAAHRRGRRARDASRRRPATSRSTPRS